MAASDQFERSSENEYYNENIACTWGSQLTGTLVSRMWYEEGKDYDYTRDTLTKFTQNFTQLLWKGSHEIGVGRARTKHGKEIIVARYHPPGNVGDFTANVLKKSELRGASAPVINSMALNRIPGMSINNVFCWSMLSCLQDRNLSFVGALTIFGSLVSSSLN